MASMNQYNPDKVSPPGATLLECIEGLGMTPVEFAQRTNIPAESIITGDTAITEEIAWELAMTLDTPVEFWVQRERLYRENNEQNTFL